MVLPSLPTYTRDMSLPTPLPADLDELDDGLPNPTPEEIAGIIEARTERLLRERARARRAG